MANMRQSTTWEVFRPDTAPDGAGGQTLTFILAGTERGDVRELTGRERIEAQQAGAEHTHSGYFRARADIARNDELRRVDLVLRVLSTSLTFPTSSQARLRITAEAIEAGN